VEKVDEEVAAGDTPSNTTTTTKKEKKGWGKMAMLKSAFPTFGGGKKKSKTTHAAAAATAVTAVAAVAPASSSSGRNRGGNGGGNGGQPPHNVLQQYLLKPKNVTMSKRVGSGAFGEVFQGTCVGFGPVAVKTMLQVTEKGVKDFKAEILLTASLRHPNIVSFVGACWGKELCCLVLEWVPKGTLAQLLEDETAALRWDEPLLRLATDVARGMAYLHGQRSEPLGFAHEKGQTTQTQTQTSPTLKSHCILHRDLKPDNVLITDFLVAKITDFGTSRVKKTSSSSGGEEEEEEEERDLRDEEAAKMTAVGTPLFCAPELMRGERYDEKVDVYSFGLLLLDMSVQEPLLDFLGERFRVAFKKKRAPQQAMRVIRKITEDGWRPVTEANPVPCAPSSVSALIASCCAPQPGDRPSFNLVLSTLSGTVSSGGGGCGGGVGGEGGVRGASVGEEVNGNGLRFGREPPTKLVVEVNELLEDAKESIRSSVSNTLTTARRRLSMTTTATAATNNLNNDDIDEERGGGGGGKDLSHSLALDAGLTIASGEVGSENPLSRQHGLLPPPHYSSDPSEQHIEMTSTVHRNENNRHQEQARQDQATQRLAPPPPPPPVYGSAVVQRATVETPLTPPTATANTF